VTATSEQQPESRGPRPSSSLPLWIAGGASVLFAAAAVGFWQAGDGEVASLREVCRQQQCDAGQRAARIAESDIHAYEGLTNASLVLSGVSLLSLGVMLLVLPSEAEPDVDVALSGDGLRIGGRF
jgi:hypothetical protein